MNATREAKLDRNRTCETNVSDPYYLHHRSLFADLRAVAVHAHGRLLDLGCGNKPYQGIFAKHVTEHIGCDIVQSSLQEVDIICPATDLPIENGSFDTVVCTQVIEHVADHQAVLREAFRVLRLNGTLLLSGPMYWPLHEEPYDFFRFTEYGLRYLLETVGFSVDTLIPNGGKWALCGQVILHTFNRTRLYRPFVIRAVNRLFAYLDDHYSGATDHMNYVVVARKLES